MHKLNFFSSIDQHCNRCSNPATHGFSFVNVEGIETFTCTGCAQRAYPRRLLEDAIEEHREACFARMERETGAIQPGMM